MLIVLVDIFLVILRIAQLFVLGAVITSWMNADENNFIVRILRETAEPLFRRVRPLASQIPGPLDWSPMLVLLGIELVKGLLLRLLLS